MSTVVKRRNFVRRAVVTLSCDRCGFTRINCDIADADLYEQALSEHVCGGAPFDLSERPALRRIITRLCDGADA